MVSHAKSVETKAKDTRIKNHPIPDLHIKFKKIGINTPECISEGKDVYKRTLAECFINGESLSSFLVRSGYAFAYRKYSKKFIKDEDFAKANKLGMWAMTFQYPWDFRKAS